MENSNQLAKRFREVLLDGKWVANTNFKAQLALISWEQAIKKVNSLNSIAELSFHVNYYIAGLLDFFENGELTIRDKYSFDMPVISSKEDWNKLVQELLSNAELFAQQLEHMSPETLEQTFVDEKYGSYRRNMEGIIEHCYYHLGQISLLRKLILED